MLVVWLCKFVCILCFCIVPCIVSPFVYSCFFIICVQFYRPLPPGGNSIAVNKYDIITNHIRAARFHHASNEYKDSFALF